MVKWALVAAFLLLSIVLLSGRGAWLIAGYNTSSKEKKAAYNEKKLCRATGVMLLIITAELVITFLAPGEILAIPALIAMVITIGVAMVYINTRCKKQ